jgi:hypothetical protein
MVIRRSDLTNEAQEIGIWNALCEAAGIEPEYDRNQEITITRIEGED